MKRRLNLHLKENTIEKLKALALDSGIKDTRVYICKKLITPYGRRMDPELEHAKNPIPNKLLYSDSKNKTICEHIMLDEDEMNVLNKLIEYHYFTNPETGKPRYSVFVACLIHYQFDKKFKSDSVKPSREETDSIDVDLMNPDRFISHEGENWGGD